LWRGPDQPPERKSNRITFCRYFVKVRRWLMQRRSLIGSTLSRDLFSQSYCRH
jgi:hypothetical protein